MPRRPPPPPTLGACIKHRREQLQLDQSEAARRAGVSRSTWIRWENDTAVPDEDGRVLLEGFLDWEPGSVVEVLAGRPPIPRRALATVTPLRPTLDQAPIDDEFIAELRVVAEEMNLPAPFVDQMIAKYRAEQAGLRERFRDEARRARG